MPDLEAKLAEYEAKLLGLVKRAQRAEIGDLMRIRSRFAEFVRQTRWLIPGNYALNQQVIPAILRELAQEIDRLTKDLQGVFKRGLSAKNELAREMLDLYGDSWLKGEIGILGFLGARPEILDAAYDYTASLIGWRHGGLAASIQGQVDAALRLAVLGAEGKTFQAQQTISQALGLGKQWTYRAERIYRTEVNRFWSLITESNLDRIDKVKPVFKRWYWSGISREEHAAIHGQTVRSSEYFRVPRKNGGVVFLSFPRAVADKHGRMVPGDCTVNCGCWHAPVPASAVGVTVIPRPLPIKRRRAA